MALLEARRFNRSPGDPPADVVAGALRAHAATLNASAWLYCGYVPLPRLEEVDPPAISVDTFVDGMFRLSRFHGFESAPVVVTTALRTSRFAAVLFWEVLHVLAPGGLWIDVDEVSRCAGTPISPEDFLARDYFRECLSPIGREQTGSFVVQTYRKTRRAAVAAGIGDQGWTFGILTASDSASAARMSADILALDLPEVEVIFCGPRPSAAPVDARVRTIDLDQPEPRGWITRKKNLLAEAARYENLCLLHDRYAVTSDWARALNEYGSCYSVLTFPHVYYADVERRFPQRYPDYQVLEQRTGLDAARRDAVYNSDCVFHPDYDDFSETAFCCGGLYIVRRSLLRRVPQDETLFHSEWEDIAFGLDCQRRGIPHRVNTLQVAESLAPHPLLLTHIHTLHAGQAPERGR
jgi:hypothetical protein